MAQNSLVNPQNECTHALSNLIAISTFMIMVDKTYLWPNTVKMTVAILY